jgi:hypothetical protein
MASTLINLGSSFEKSVHDHICSHMIYTDVQTNILILLCHHKKAETSVDHRSLRFHVILGRSRVPTIPMNSAYVRQSWKNALRLVSVVSENVTLELTCETTLTCTLKFANNNELTDATRIWEIAKKSRSTSFNSSKFCCESSNKLNQYISIHGMSVLQTTFADVQSASPREKRTVRV